MASNMNELVGLVIGLMIISVVLYLGPGIGQQVSDAMPINKSGDFANSTTGASVWTHGTAIIGVVVLVIFIAVAIRALKGIQGGNQ